MENTRRSFLKLATGYGSLLSVFPNIYAQTQNTRNLPRPNPALFESGDFLWPKNPKAFVPYNSGSPNSPSQDKEQWAKERESYLNSTSDNDETLQRRRKMLREMDYREFIAIYEGDQKIGEPGVYSGGSVYVGHVAMLEVDSNKTAWVIEALLGKGIVRKTYVDWVKERENQIVWLGRLKNFDAQQRAKLVPEAKKHIGKPYDFWNFDLNDDKEFYCSKLCWLSIYRSLGVAVDGNKNPKRLLWFSPKQLLYLDAINIIHNPGSYAL